MGHTDGWSGMGHADGWGSNGMSYRGSGDYMTLLFNVRFANIQHNKITTTTTITTTFNNKLLEIQNTKNKNNRSFYNGCKLNTFGEVDYVCRFFYVQDSAWEQVWFGLSGFEISFYGQINLLM